MIFSDKKQETYDVETMSQPGRVILPLHNKNGIGL